MDAVLMLTLWQTWSHNISEDIENDESDCLPCLLLVGDLVDDTRVGADRQHGLHQTVQPRPASGVAVSQC